MTDDSFWEGVAVGAGIIGLIVTPIVGAWLYFRTRRNEQRISNLEKYFENRISEFQQTLYESERKRDEEYRFLWKKIQSLEATTLTLEEKNRLLSYLDEAYQQKLAT